MNGRIKLSGPQWSSPGTLERSGREVGGEPGAGSN